MMFGRAFSHHGEIERASRCRGIYMRRHLRASYGVARMDARVGPAVQVLRYTTSAYGDTRSRAYPGDVQLLRSNVWALQPQQMRISPICALMDVIPYA